MFEITHKLEGEQTLYMEDCLSFLEELIRGMAKAKRYSQVFRNKLKTKTPEEWAKELYAHTIYGLKGTPMYVLAADYIKNNNNMAKERLEKEIYRFVILHKDAVLKEKHIYKYSISLDGKCYCKCGTQFEYNEEYDEKICPNCFNTYFRHMSRDSGPVVLSSDWNFFEDEDRIKIRAHKYVAVSWRGIISTHRVDYKMVVLNIKTGRSYYLFKKKEKDRYQILSFNIWTSSSMKNCPEEFVKKLFDAFNRKTNYRHQRLFDKMVFVGEPEYKTEYVLWLENYFVKEEWGEKNKPEKIQVKYNSRLIQLMVVLNRNPEIDVVLEHIATICDSKLFWLVVEKILKDFPKGKLDGKPHEALSKILNTKITKPILRDYVNGVFDHKEFSLYSNLCEFFGLDNAREISKAKILCYCNRYTYMFLEKLVKDSGNKTIAKNKLLRLARTIGIGICEDIMRMNKMLVEMGEEAAEVNFVRMTPDEIKNIHDNLSISLTIINNRGYEEHLRKRIPEMTKYEYTNGTYKIIAPKEIMDLNKEGHHMHHCVASYCQSVADGTCYIFFVRDMEDNRVATVEVRTENKHVVQVKAKYNKKPEDEVLDFVNEWTNKFGLEFSYDCW